MRLGGDPDALVVMRGVWSALRDMPKHSGWINNVSDPKAPRLERRCFRCRHTKSLREIQRSQVSPPRV